MAEHRPLTVVVVTYHSEKVIGDCLRSLHADADAGVRIVVVDNASTDDTLDVVEAVLPAAVRLPLPDNRGYSAAINAALDHVRPSGDVLVLNPDINVRGGTLAALQRAAGGRTGVTVPRLVEPDGTTAMSIRHEPTAGRAWAEALIGGRLAGRLGMGETVTRSTSYQRQHSIDWATGAAMLLTAQCRAAVGAFDESFFLYSEETDFMLRAGDAGFRVTFVPDAIVVHRGGNLATSAELWSRRTVNRVRLQRRRRGRVSTASFLGASLAAEGIRAVGGRPVNRRATAELLRAGPRIIAAGPPPLQPERELTLAGAAARPSLTSSQEALSMELAEVGRIVLKHKVVAGFFLVLTVVASFAAFTKAPLTYQTEASLVVLAPTKEVVTGSQTAADGPRTINPFLNFGGSQEAAAQVLVVRMSDDVVGRTLDQVGVNGPWKFEIKGDSGPVVQVTATAATPALAKAAAGHIVDEATHQLTALQKDAGSPDDQYLSASVVSTPSDPTPVYDTKIRLTLLVAALGLLLTVGIPMALEGIKRRRSPAATDDAVGEPEVAAGPVELDELIDLDDLDLEPSSSVPLDELVRLDEELTATGTRAADDGDRSISMFSDVARQTSGVDWPGGARRSDLAPTEDDDDQAPTEALQISGRRLAAARRRAS